MSEATPQERDLAIGRHAVMAEAFELLADHLGPFIDARMAEYFADEPSWAEAAANRLGRPAEHGATDPLFQLLVLRRFWGPVFADFYGQDLRQIIGQLIDTRNMWAHFSLSEETTQLQHSVLAIERLLAPVKPEIAGRLRQLRSRVGDPNTPALVVGPATVAAPSSQEATATAPPPPAAANTVEDAEPPTRSPARPLVSAVHPTPATVSNDPATGVDDTPGVDVDTLLAQLTETESVFRELQGQYGDLQAELSQSRRITANKQLKLSVMEQRLVEVEDHSLSVLEDLMEERVTRHHIEWLIVGLLATLLLFMVLAST
jgi:hypothetical protein